MIKDFIIKLDLEETSEVNEPSCSKRKFEAVKVLFSFRLKREGIVLLFKYSKLVRFKEIDEFRDSAIQLSSEDICLLQTKFLNSLDDIDKFDEAEISKIK